MGNIIAGITDPIISLTCPLVPEACALIPGLVPTDAPTMSPTVDTCPDFSVDSCLTGQVKAQVTYDPTKCTGGDDEYDSLVYYGPFLFPESDGLATIEDIEAAASFKRTCQSPQETLVDTFCLPSDETGYSIYGFFCPSGSDGTVITFESTFKFELLEGAGVSYGEGGAVPQEDGSLLFIANYGIN